MATDSKPIDDVSFAEVSCDDQTIIKINNNISLDIAGENALILYFTNSSSSTVTDLKSNIIKEKSVAISPAINAHVQQAVTIIRQHLATSVIDLIPSYGSILVVFDLLTIDHHSLRKQLKQLLINCEAVNNKQGRLVELPAYYSAESGIDLPRIAKHANLTVEQVIQLHQAQEYRVYAIGFAPGFAYLGEVDERIAMPRLATPRLKVPKGAIAIADQQTAVYPAQSPGGWNIIGLCPTDMFNAEANPTMPVEVGDRVKFVAISKQEFLKLGGQLDANSAEDLNKTPEPIEKQSKAKQVC
ncbi:5-oxoprolinase subunit PxpB [Colwellia sp. E2M01]|uniref:5-oxoprolinase subunit PxpB n=1 Tax=Colwellia sp. E2M01 TaxID=2841561 RepID=UPI001C09EB08|nr:5-oxoprolinase subunit PxpB [Colwellia sp. E2M01]MBU2869712.1 5-oxoprolinase subunit PxpB [Colwellia sp. E2M01]